MTDTNLRTFIHALPKTETHLHIEGALPWRLLQELDGIKYAATPPSWEGHFKFRDFAHFDETLLGHAMAWYVSPERYHHAATEVFKELKAQNVRYVETSFASGVIEFFGVHGKGILDGILSAVPEGLEVRGLSRHPPRWPERENAAPRRGGADLGRARRDRPARDRDGSS